MPHTALSSVTANIAVTNCVDDYPEYEWPTEDQDCTQDWPTEHDHDEAPYRVTAERPHWVPNHDRQIQEAYDSTDGAPQHRAAGRNADDGLKAEHIQWNERNQL